MEAGHSFPYERKLPALIRTYRTAQREIAAQIRAAVLAGNLDQAIARRRQLQAVLDVLNRLGFETDAQARQILAAAVTESAQATTQAMIGIGITAPTPASFGGVNAEAVAVMQDAMVGRLQDARRTVGRRVEDVFARAGRRSTMLALLGASDSRRAASTELGASLRAQGATGFVDRAGRHWALDTYAQMVMRTTTREAVVEAAKLRMAAHGITIARVSTSAKPCPICEPWQGTLVALDGQASDYRGEPVATLGALPSGGPPFHPNCRHTLLPVATLIDDIKAELGGGAGGRSGPGGGGAGGAGGASGGGDSLADKLQTSSPRVAPIIARTAAAVDKVHATPAALPRIPVTAQPRGRAFGHYSPSERKIAVRPAGPRGPHPELTLAHEVGHALDHLHFGAGRQLASAGTDSRLDQWRQAVRASGAHRDLTRHATEPGTPPRVRRHITNYLLSLAELWARSYAQWIATRSADPALRAQLDGILGEGPLGARQWEDQDFEPIAKALDAIFDTEGLLR